MVNNGIEYGNMQLIHKAYHIMKNTLQTRPSDMQLICEASYIMKDTLDIDNNETSQILNE